MFEILLEMIFQNQSCLKPDDSVKLLKDYFTIKCLKFLLEMIFQNQSCLKPDDS